MNPRVLRRFVILMALLTVGGFMFWDVIGDFISRPPGDYHTDAGGNRMADGLYDEALEEFDAALEESPDHRGALQGRATTYLLLERYEEAEAEFTYLIDYLEKTIEADDTTGRGVLFSAFANRANIKDRQGRYEEALEDYIQSIRIDADLADGPGIVAHILYYNRKPSSVRDRARYLYEQLQLPEEERVMRIPELDDEQRMYRP